MKIAYDHDMTYQLKNGSLSESIECYVKLTTLYKL
jgi:hypothetical protein